jgi:hypothetical protein
LYKDSSWQGYELGLNYIQRRSRGSAPPLGVPGEDIRGYAWTVGLKIFRGFDPEKKTSPPLPLPQGEEESGLEGDERRGYSSIPEARKGRGSGDSGLTV